MSKISIKNNDTTDVHNQANNILANALNFNPDLTQNDFTNIIDDVTEVVHKVLKYEYDGNINNNIRAGINELLKKNVVISAFDDDLCKAIKIVKFLEDFYSFEKIAIREQQEVDDRFTVALKYLYNSLTNDTNIQTTLEELYKSQYSDAFVIGSLDENDYSSMVVMGQQEDSI